VFNIAHGYFCTTAEELSQLRGLILYVQLFRREGQSGGKKVVSMMSLIGDGVKMEGKVKIRLSSLLPNHPQLITLPLEGELGHCFAWLSSVWYQLLGAGSLRSTPKYVLLMWLATASVMSNWLDVH
jgi:hypothetical protein